MVLYIDMMAILACRYSVHSSMMKQEIYLLETLPNFIMDVISFMLFILHIARRMAEWIVQKKSAQSTFYRLLQHGRRKKDFREECLLFS